MHRFWPVALLTLGSTTALAVPPEPMPISPTPPVPRQAAAAYFDDVEGLARLAWQATRCPDEPARLAAVEQMARVCAHPRRVDPVLSAVEANDPSMNVRQAAQRVRVQLRVETASMGWVEAENQAAEGRSVVAHNPIPYREALSSLRTTPAHAALAAPTPAAASAASNTARNHGLAVPQQEWSVNVQAARMARAQNLPKRDAR